MVVPVVLAAQLAYPVQEAQPPALLVLQAAMPMVALVVMVAQVGRRQLQVLLVVLVVLAEPVVQRHQAMVAMAVTVPMVVLVIPVLTRPQVPVQ